MTRVQLPAEIGGSDAAAAVGQDIQDLRDLLNSYCTNNYSTIEEVCVILRVSGSVADYGEEGFEKLRHSPKGSYVSVEAIIPASRWMNSPKLGFRSYLFATVKNAIERCIERLRKKSVSVDGDVLAQDLEVVRQLYIKSRA